MKEEDFLLFKRKTELILNTMNKLGIKFRIVSGPDINNPAYFIKFANRNLRYWKMGIWATGSWGNLYDIKSNSEVTIFMIHDWYFDKWRPSSSDISWGFLPESNYFEDFIFDLIEIKNNPIKSFRDIYFPESNRPRLKYIKEWYLNEVYRKMNYKLKKVTSWTIYRILLLISFFDKRMIYTRIFDNYEEEVYSFLASLKCSENDKSFHKFYKLYSYIPTKICKSLGIRSRFNVSDYSLDMTDEDLKIRMFKGVIER